MADIALVTAGRVEVVGPTVRQRSEMAGADIDAGDAYTYNASGAAIPSDADLAGSNTLRGIALRSVKSGEGFTGLQEGNLDGYDFTAQAYGTAIFVSNTGGGVLGDAAGVASLPVGHVRTALATQLGTVDKILHVNIAG